MSKLSLNFKTYNCAKPVICYCIIAIIISLVMGCSSAPKKVDVPLMKFEPEDFITSQKDTIPNRPIVIQTSLNDNRPAWINKPVFEQGDSVYFSGGFQNGGDYSVSLRAANAEALKTVAQTISQHLQAEFSIFNQGTNQAGSEIDRYIQDGLATFTRNLHLQGIRQTESYYEEMHDPTNPMKPFFNAWVKLEFSKSDYLRAKAEVLKQLKDEFQNAGETEAKEKAQQILDDLKGQISEAI